MRLPWSKRAEPEKRDAYGYSVVLAAAYRNAMAGGIPVTPDSALRLMAVYGCIRIISEDIASLPLPVYKRLRRGREAARDYPLYELLHDQPNPEMSAITFRETLTAHLLTYGNAYANIEVKNGRATALWPLRPTQVSLRRMPNGALEYMVTPVSADQLQVRIPLNRMFHIPGLSINGIQGLSPIALARETIGLGLSQQTFASGFFDNGAQPGGVLEHPASLSEEAHKRLIEDWNSTHGGVANSGKTALLEEGMKYNPVQIGQKDSQFIEQTQATVLDICRMFRVQPHKLAVLEGSMAYASVEQSNIDHVVSTIRPWAVRWEQAIRKDLIPVEDRGTYYAEHEMAGLLRGDNAGRANFYRTMANIGALSINEIREFENMNPVPGGDEHFIPLNVGTVDDVANPEPSNVTPFKGAVNG